MKEVVLANDAQETMRLAAGKYGRLLFMLGESLGCGVAASVKEDRRADP